MDTIHAYSSLPSLDSIRLLCLQPGSWNEPITCSLEMIENYISAREYVAISYAWGDAHDTIEIICDGIVFQITRSLHDALRHLRDEHKARLLWADAICIDQKNVMERNQQVSRMRQIYLHASSIFIWAGQADEHSAQILKLIRHIAHRCCEVIYGPESPQVSWLLKLRLEQDRTYVAMKTILVKVDIPETDWQPLWNFYQRDWFFRTWVIQEVEYHPQIWLSCGGSGIEWDFVALAANWLYHAPRRHSTIHWKRDYFPSYQGFQNAYLMWESWSTRRDAPFLALLSLVRRFKATDPRDKVFAVLQHQIRHVRFSKEGQRFVARLPARSSHDVLATHLGLKPDYNLTTEETYLQVALHAIHGYKNLEVLSYAWQTAHLDTSSASWVPRWDLPVDQNNASPLLPFLYDAARGKNARLLPVASSRFLKVEGLVLGRITDSDMPLEFGATGGPSASFHNEGGLEAHLTMLSRIMVQDRWQSVFGYEHAAGRAIENLEAHLADFAAYLLPIMRAFGRDAYIPLCSTWCSSCNNTIVEHRKAYSHLAKVYTCHICEQGDFDLCSNCHELGIHCKDPKHSLQKVTPSSIWCPYTQGIVDWLECHKAGGNGDRFFETAKSACRGRTFFHIAPGWIGVGPQIIEPGDMVVVLFGSRVPIILRKINGCYRLVSDCYIHGLMDGEAIQMLENGKLETEVFEIQ